MSWISKTPTVKQAADDGYNVIMSDTDFYLDHLDVPWQKFYLNDPLSDYPSDEVLLNPDSKYYSAELQSSAERVLGKLLISAFIYYPLAFLPLETSQAGTTSTNIISTLWFDVKKEVNCVPGVKQWTRLTSYQPSTLEHQLEQNSSGPTGQPLETWGRQSSDYIGFVVTYMTAESLQHQSKTRWREKLHPGRARVGNSEKATFVAF